MANLFADELPPQRKKENSNLFNNEAPGKLDSALSGFNRPFEKVAEGGLSKAFPDWQGLQQTRQKTSQEYEEAKEANPFSTAAGEVLGSFARDLPAYYAAGGVLGAAGEAVPFLGRAASLVHKGLPKYSKDVGSAFLGGSTVGGLEAYLQNNENPSERALEEGAMAAGVTAAFPALKVPYNVAKAGGKYIKDFVEPATDYLSYNFKILFPGAQESHIMGQLFKGVDRETAKEALEKQAKARKYGLNLTPAEASGNPEVAARESSAVKSAENRPELHKFKEGQKAAQEQAIEGFKAQIQNPTPIKAEGAKPVPYSGDIDSDLVKAAKGAIEHEKGLRKAKATPLYESSKKDMISDEAFAPLTEDAVVMDAYKRVLKNKAYATKLKGVDPKSIEFVDYVKKNIDDQINAARRAGNNHEADLLGDSKKRLTDVADSVSPKYKEARMTYSSDSPAVQALEQSEVGKLAGMKPLEAKKALKTIFDEEQPNSKRISDIRDALIKSDPKNKKLWDEAVTEHVERKLDTAMLDKAETHGTNFFNRIANTNRRMNQMEEGLKDNPAAVETLRDLKGIFRNVVNSRSPKGEAGRAENNMNQARSLGGWMSEYMHKIFLKNKETKLVEMLKSGEWDKALKEDPRSLFQKISDFSGERVPDEIKKNGPKYLAIQAKKAIDERKKEKEPLTLEINYKDQGKK